VIFRRTTWTLLLIMLSVLYPLHAQLRYVQQRTADGVLEGVVSPDGKVRTFKGIPYAAPPVGPLRWKAPQPVQPWTGVRRAVEYPPRCMQARVYTDMVFNDSGPSEDCLYLNLWMPEHHAPGKLPVMVWIYGGGFVAGASSEPRQDAGNLSKKGVLVVSLNYRLGVFGLLAHPDLTRESANHASGDYGLLDQVTALQWVKKNIATFGGDPDNVTIFGESAGSFSVSALVASPLAKGLFRRAIGESGACFSSRRPMKTLAEAEKSGEEFAQSAFGADSIAALRAKPAQQILDAAQKEPQGYFSPDIDGYFLPASCESIYEQGGQSHVPLLAGWNRDEGSYRSFFDGEAPTLDNYDARVKSEFGSNAAEILKLYPATTDAEVKTAAHDLATDRFTAYSTWKWLEMQVKTGESPVYRYEFDQALPLPVDAQPGDEPSAPHASEIEYVFRVLSSKVLPWRPEDRQVSEMMASYWTNFAKTGNPNGPDLPHWPAYTGSDNYEVMHLMARPYSAADAHRARYDFFSSLHNHP